MVQNRRNFYHFAIRWQFFFKLRDYRFSIKQNFILNHLQATSSGMNTNNELFMYNFLMGSTISIVIYYNKVCQARQVFFCYRVFQVLFNKTEFEHWSHLNLVLNYLFQLMLSTQKEKVFVSQIGVNTFYIFIWPVKSDNAIYYPKILKNNIGQP